MHARIRLGDDSFDVWLARDPDGLKIEVDGTAHAAEARPADGAWKVTVGDRAFVVELDGDAVVVDGKRFPLGIADVRATGGPGAHGPRGSGEVRPPMPGKIVAVKVKPGDKVEAGQTLLVLEAMKMQNEITATGAGTVKDVKVQQGQNVEAKDVLVTIE